MNFFESELKKLLENDNSISEKRFVGRACFGKLTDKLRVRLEFITLGTADHYEALKATIINRNDGPIDAITLRFSDLLGVKTVNNPNFKNGIVPHIWRYGEKTEWYVYVPTKADNMTIHDVLNEYLDVFREPTQEMEHGMTMNHS